MLRPSGFFALRAPVLPFEALLETGEPEGLRRLLAEPQVRDALLVGSSQLLDAAGSAAPGQRLRVDAGLARYLSRMAGRATPYGLFATSSSGTLGKETRLRLADRAACVARATVDLDILDAIATRLLETPGVLERVPLRPNTTLVRTAGESLRYAEVQVGERGRTCHLVSVEATPYLEELLLRAKQGALLDELAAVLVESGADPDEARAYLRELVRTQILVPEFAPALTGEEPLRSFAAAARSAGAVVPAQILESVAEHLERGGILAAAAALEPLTDERDPSKLFHVELQRPGDFMLGQQVVRELEKAASLATRLTPRPPDGALARFRQAFTERWGDREVPLVAALDEESGLGFDAQAFQSSPIAGLPLGAPPARAVRFGKREARLVELLARAARERLFEVALDDGDLAALSVEDALPPPDAFAVAATLVAPDEAAVDRGEFQLVLDGVAGPSGARLLARFCHADAQLLQQVREHLRAEEALRPDALFVEVVHRPEGRVGNVLVRPLLRERELPLLARSGAERQLPLDDLLVRVAGDRVVLRSRSLDREILPRSTTAHNHEAFGLPAYRLLCALQAQGVAASAGWSWGVLDAAPFLPRIRCGRIVLSRARWLLRRAELSRLGDPSTCVRAMQDLRRTLALPRFVALQEGDQSLPVDLDNQLLVQALALSVRARDEARLSELFPGPDALCVRSPAGRHVHELIVPFVRETTATAQPPPQRAPRPLARTFAPGSEWLTAKLYCGKATADALLRDLVGPLVDRALSSGASDGWFFLRYADPGHHLRLRLHGAPERLSGEVLRQLHDALGPLLASGAVFRLQLDTYDREVERYGGAAAIGLVEKIFEADSAAARAIVCRTSDAALRFRAALQGQRALATDLGIEPGEQQRLLRELRASFLREHGGPRLEPHLSARFRAERAALEDEPVPELTAILEERSRALAPIVEQLRALESDGELDTPLLSLAPSLWHMHANRVLREEAREQELLLYDFWLRLMRSQAARAR